MLKMQGFLLHNGGTTSKRLFSVVVMKEAWGLVEEASMDLVHEQIISF